ncbi:unnamed protein product, partial [marine sediment metagenome]
DGYLKIGNKTIDNLIDNKSVSNKMRAYLLTVRMVNGWDKESLEIPVSTYSKKLRIGKRYTKRLLKELKEENLIHRNGSLTSIPGDYIQWWWSGQNLPPPQGGHNLPKGGSKVTTGRVVRNYHPKHSNTPNKHTRGFATQLSRKEIDKLEGMDYFRAEMINDGNFELKYIDDLIKNNSFMVLYDSWLEYTEASNIRNKPGFFISLVEKYRKKR